MQLNDRITDLTAELVSDCPTYSTVQRLSWKIFTT